MNRTLFFGFRGAPQIHATSTSSCFMGKYLPKSSSFLTSFPPNTKPLLSSCFSSLTPSFSFTSSFTPQHQPILLPPSCSSSPSPSSSLTKRWMTLSNISTEELETKIQDFLKEKKFVQVILLWEELEKRVPELQLKTIRGIGSTFILLHKPKEGLQLLRQAVDIACQRLQDAKEEKQRIEEERDSHSQEREKGRELEGKEMMECLREWFLSRLALGNGLRDSGELAAAEEYEALLSEKLTTYLRARILYDQGMLLLDHKQQKEARKSFQEAVRILVDENFSTKKQILLSDAYLQLGNSFGDSMSRKAFDHWKQGLQIAQRCGNTPTIHECLAHLLFGYSKSGDREMTVRLQYMYAQLMRNERRWEEARETHLELGETLLAIGRPLEAIDEIQKALQLSQNNSFIGECRYQIGLAYLHQNDQSDQAELLFQSALLCLYPDSQNDLCASAAAAMSITNRGLVVEKRELSLPENPADPNLLRCLVSISLNLSYQGKQSLALQYAELAAQIQIQCWEGYSHAMRLTNGAVGVIYGELNRFEQALQLLSFVYSSSVKEGDKENILFSLGWLGKIYQFHDNHESAKGYFSKQLKMAVDVNNPWMKAQAMKSMAWSNARSKNFEQALAVLEQHVPLAIKLAQRESAIGSVRLAKFLYVNLGNKARAERMERLANELERQLT